VIGSGWSSRSSANDRRAPPIANVSNQQREQSGHHHLFARSQRQDQRRLADDSLDRRFLREINEKDC
jgi:hypothetical protein